jgi:Tfp pilus assembly protein PilN
VNFDENGTIDIVGISESMSRVFNLVSALEDSDLFKNVKTKSTSTKQERGKDVAAFEITFRLESAPEEEVANKDGAKAAGKEGAKDEKKDEKKGEKKGEKKADKEVKKEKSKE